MKTLMKTLIETRDTAREMLDAEKDDKARHFLMQCTVHNLNAAIATLRFYERAKRQTQEKISKINQKSK